MTTILQRLNVRLPIIQAPMAGSSNPRMAAAVSNAGALGSLGLGSSNASTARKAIRELKALTDGAYNVNFFVHKAATNDLDVGEKWIEALRSTFALYNAKPPDVLSEIYKSFAQDEEMVKVLEEEKPPVISFHFGLPSLAVIARLKSMGGILFATATSLDEARQAEQAGIDALVAQGYEAGGHRGIFDPDGPDDQLSTFALVRLLVKETSLPVIAAGGIMDGQGICAALDLGAIAAQMGTAFVLTDESSADEAYRGAMQSEANRHTIMTKSISGRPARSLRNRFTQLGEGVQAKVPDYPLTYDIGKALNTAAKAKGEGGYGSQWAGQGAPLVRAMSCAQLVQLLAQELHLGIQN